MNKNNKRFSFVPFIALYLGMVLSFGCKDIVEEQCEGACEFFVKCAEKERGVQLSETDRSSGRIQCIQGCTMIQGDILRCYQEVQDSCEGMKQCLLQSGALE